MDDRMHLKKDLKEKTELVNIIIDRFLPRKDEFPKEIHKAMRHTLFAGGKRLRPYLAVLTFSLFSDDYEKIYPIASAIELLHTYTLVHDDLPEIDNDEYRRGKKTCHSVYGPDIALLAGDALLVNAFHLIYYANIDNMLKKELIRDMAVTCGERGLIAGQTVDILSENKDVDEETLYYIHENKTAKLINMSIRFGCITAGAEGEDLKVLEQFGNKIGLTFQIVDDILDIEGDQKKLGKTIGKDIVSKKVTFPSLIGLEASKKKAEDLTEDAIGLLERYGDKAKTLKLLAKFILTRKF